MARAITSSAVQRLPWLQNPLQAHKDCRWLAAMSLKLDQVKQAHIEDFLGSLRGRKNAPASVRTMRTYLAEIYRVFTHLRGLKRPCALGSKQ